MAKQQHKLQTLGRFIKRHIVILITFLQVISALMLGLSAASVYVSPASCSWAAILGLAFPLFALILIAVGLITLFICPKRIWISAVGMLACCGSIRNYFPINIPTEHPAGAWHVITWNVGGVTTQDEKVAELVETLAAEHVDLLALQEVNTKHIDTLSAALKPTLPYCSKHLTEKEAAGVCVYSRWPEVESEVVSQNALNMVYASKFLLAPGDTLIVVNCHLQSTHIDHTTRDDYAAIMHNEDVNSETKSTTTRTLINKVRTNSAVRALQAEATAEYLAQHKGCKFIVLGDFNDTPISFSRQRIVDAGNLMDCFRESGNGISRSFNRNAFYVRIDHILTSKEHFESYETHTLPTRLSDHYPVSTYLMPKSSDPLP